MAKNRYIGIRAQAGAFTSTTWGNPLTAANAHYIDQTSEDIGIDQGFIFPETSAQRVMRNRIPGQIAISGDIQVPVYSVGTPTMIYYALGKVTKAANAAHASVHDRVITAATVPPTFQMSVGKDRREHRFMGCCVQSMTLDYDPSETLLATFTVMARQEIASAAVATGTLFPDYNDLERAIGGTEVNTKIGVDGGTPADVNFMESVNIEMDNGFVDDNYVLGSRYVPAKYAQNHTVTGSMEIGYDSYERYEAVTDEEQWRVLLNGPVRGSGETTRQVRVELPQLALNNVNLPTEGTDRYILSLDYTGERRGNSDDLLIVTVTNAEADDTLDL